MTIHDDKTFEDVNYVGTTISGAEFNNCIFRRCDLSNSVFNNNKFIDCVFDSCNLSVAKLTKSVMNNVDFRNCKVLGVNFTECDDFLFTLSFKDCILDYSSFMGKKMSKTLFLQTSLKEVSFTGANLSGAVFNNTDLENAVFSNTDLTGADFTNAYNYTFDPEQNILRKAIFSTAGLHGLLVKHGIKVV